jgi:succinate dehydrogenase hydrophobic anchor subunit
MVCSRWQNPWTFSITMHVLFIGLYHLRLQLILFFFFFFFFNQFSSYVEVMVFVSWSSILMAFLFFGKLF